MTSLALGSVLACVRLNSGQQNIHLESQGVYMSARKGLYGARSMQMYRRLTDYYHRDTRHHHSESVAARIEVR